MIIKLQINTSIRANQKVVHSFLRTSSSPPTIDVYTCPSNGLVR